MPTEYAESLWDADFAALFDGIREASRRGDCDHGLVLTAEADAVASTAMQHAAALRERARFLTWAGDLESAIAACEEAREGLLHEDADREWCDLAVAQAFALTGLGLVEEAMDLLGQARGIARRLNDRALQYWVCNRTGFAYDSFGEHAVARDLLNEALALSDAVDDQSRWSIITNLVNNAMALIPVLRAAAENDQAEQVLSTSLAQAAQAVRHCQDSRRQYELCLSLGNLGAIQQLAGDPELALRTLERARRIADHNSYRPLLMSAMQHMPAALLDLGRGDEAIAVLHTVLEQSRELGELPVQVEVLCRLAEIHERRSEFAEALTSFRAFHDAEKQLRSGQALTRGRLLAHQAHLEQARVEAAEARARNNELLSDKQALLLQTAELERRAHTDALTGLANRRYVDTALPALHEQARSAGQALWVAVMDLDHFKQVNDMFGHRAGDEVLVRVAELLRTVCRPEDLLARYGGEEFLLAMLDVSSDAAYKICDRLRRRIQDETWAGIGSQLRVTVSVGLSISADTSYADTIHYADQLLYRAKAAGRNQVMWSVTATGAGPRLVDPVAS